MNTRVAIVEFIPSTVNWPLTGSCESLLPLSLGDRIFDVKDLGLVDWLYGRLFDGREGFFPAKYTIQAVTENVSVYEDSDSLIRALWKSPDRAKSIVLPLRNISFELPPAPGPLSTNIQTRVLPNAMNQNQASTVLHDRPALIGAAWVPVPDVLNTVRPISAVLPPVLYVELSHATQRAKIVLEPRLNDVCNKSSHPTHESTSIGAKLINPSQRSGMHDFYADPRSQRHIFLIRLDLLDVMMIHPDAWGLLESRKLSLFSFDDWTSQIPSNTAKELADAQFYFWTKIKAIGSDFINGLATGRIPNWLKGLSELSVDLKTSCVVPEDASRLRKVVDSRLLLDSGLADPDEVLLHMDDAKHHETRIIGPDVLPSESVSFRISGNLGLRIYLLNRGFPDSPNVHNTVNDIAKTAIHLGIEGDYHYYWFALFLLRYPLPKEWQFVQLDGMKSYQRLGTDGQPSFSQPWHPMLPQFRTLLLWIIDSEIFWNYRGLVTTKCVECRSLGGVLWCLNCSDIFCLSCFSRIHKRRTGGHTAVPVPGSPYLSSDQVRSIATHVHLLNVGSCNRRRFLSIDNQSDKYGPCLCHWLQVDNLAHEVPLIRGNARIGPVYYNFATGERASRSDFVTSRNTETKAAITVQGIFRGFCCRDKVHRRTLACLMIQNRWRSWLAQRRRGHDGPHASILRLACFMLHRSVRNEILVASVRRLQARVKGRSCRTQYSKWKMSAVKIQALWRSFNCRRTLKKRCEAAVHLQSFFRRILYGDRPVFCMSFAAATLQGFIRSRNARVDFHKRHAAARKIQGLYRGRCLRSSLACRRDAALALQSAWRNFQSRLICKVALLDSLEAAVSNLRLEIRQLSVSAAVALIQRNYRLYLVRRRLVTMREERARCNRSAITIVGLSLVSLGGVSDFIHPWWRHLPPGICRKLDELKNGIQRSIAKQPLVNKSSGEYADLVAAGRTDDTASAILALVMKELLPGGGIGEAENSRVSESLRWTSHAIAHECAYLRLLMKSEGFRNHSVELCETSDGGVNVSGPCRPGEPLLYLKKDNSELQTMNDRRIQLPDENLWLLGLVGCSNDRVRRVFVTAEVLVTFREALEQPRLRLESNLSFQGVDGDAAAQIFDVISCELRHRLPHSWAVSIGQTSCEDVIEAMMVYFPRLNSSDYAELSRSTPEEISKSHRFFTRDTILSLLQELAKTVSAAQLKSKRREISELSELFAMSKKTIYQEHCPFVLGVVVLHLVLRGLLLRTLFHKAAVSIQSAYIRFRKRLQRIRVNLPVLTIQRVWRGFVARKVIYSIYVACLRIQRNIKAVWRSRRNRCLIARIKQLQCWMRSVLQKRWIQRVRDASVYVQRYFRGNVVRVTLDNDDGRRIIAFTRDQLAVLGKSKTIAESIATRAVLMTQARLSLHDVRQRALDRRYLDLMYRAGSARISVPARESVFEFPARRRGLSRFPGKSSTTELQALIASAHHALQFSGLVTGDFTDRFPRIHVSAMRGLAQAKARKLRSFSRSTQGKSMAILDITPWIEKAGQSLNLPLFILSALSMKAHHQSMELCHLLAYCICCSFLSRNDSKRPPIGHRLQFWGRAVVGLSTTPLNEHMDRIQGLIAAKVASDAKFGISTAMATSSRILVGVLNSLFKKLSNESGAECRSFIVLNSAKSAMRTMLSQIWLEAGDQFTTRFKDGGKYRGLKFRPDWDVLDGPVMRAASATCLPLVPVTKVVPGKVKAARLDDFVDDAISINFGIEVIHGANEILIGFMERMVEKKVTSDSSLTRKMLPPDVVQPATADVDLSAILRLVTKLVSGSVDRLGDSKVDLAALVGHILEGVWIGFAPKVREQSDKYISGLTSAGTTARLPPLTGSYSRSSRNFSWCGESSIPPPSDFVEYVSRIPWNAVAVIIRFQGLFRGWRVRRMYMHYLKTLAKYCKVSGWPPRSSIPVNALPVEKPRVIVEEQDPLKLVRRVAGQRPKLASFIVKKEPPEDNAGNLLSGVDLVQADHLACANLFFLYMHSVWLSAELLRIWFTSCWGFYQLLDRFSCLLVSNPRLVPMSEAVAAQLRNREPPRPQTTLPSSKEEFLSRRAAESTLPTALNSVTQGGVVDAVLTHNVDVSANAAEFLKDYLVMTDGDDSQFRDIDSNVIPLSAGGGQSPPKQRPEDYLINHGERVDAVWCMKRLQPMWIGIKPSRFAASRARLANNLRTAELVRSFSEFEKAGNFAACIKLLDACKVGNLNVLIPSELVRKQPYWIEMVLHMIAGYTGLAVKNGSPEKAAALILQTISALPVALRDLHPLHQSVLAALIFDSALGVAYSNPLDSVMKSRAQQFFHEASERYLAVSHLNRHARCALRYACVLHAHGRSNEAEFFLTQAVQRLADKPPSSLLAVAHLNRAVIIALQRRPADAEIHARAAGGIVRALPKLKTEFLQAFENTLWLLKRLRELPRLN